MKAGNVYWLADGQILPASRCCCNEVCQASLYFCRHEYWQHTMSLLGSFSLKQWYMLVGKSSMGGSSSGNWSANLFRISSFNLANCFTFAITLIWLFTAATTLLSLCSSASSSNILMVVLIHNHSSSNITLFFGLLCCCVLLLSFTCNVVPIILNPVFLSMHEASLWSTTIWLFLRKDVREL